MGGNARYGQCGHGGASKSGWNLISALRTKIQQIAVGDCRSVLLDCDGVVLSCGGNSLGQLGLGHTERDASMLPTAIPVFQEQNIKITKITAGGFRTLAIDSECRAYAWGHNESGQC